MKIIIIYPKKYFSQENLNSLKGQELKFIEGNNIDLEKIPELFQKEQYILVVDPTYLKDGWKAFPDEKIDKMVGLKSLCLAVTSFTWINGEKLKKLGKILTNTPSYCTEAVAEFNIYMMFSLLRKLPLIVKNNWKMDYENFINKEVRGLNAGIIGLGKIGSRVAELCKGLGMNVSYWNRSKKESLFKLVELNDLFQKSDVIFNTVRMTPENKGFITEKLISNLNKKSLIISTSNILLFSDYNHIIKQVKTNNLGGFAFESIDKKITDFEGNISVFPEQAYYTLGTLKNATNIVTETILSAPINRVN